MKSTMTQSQINIELNINEFGNIDHEMGKHVRIGDPSIEFDTGRQLYVLSDNTVSLDDIIFRERVAGTATADGEIKIIIPDEAPFIWIDAGTSNIEEGSGSVSSNIIHTDQILQVNVTTDFGSDVVMIITDARIQMTDETASDVFLTLQVNSNGPDDGVMESDDYIRIGQPTIISNDTQYLVYSDPTEAESMMMAEITITDGSAPIINPDNHIQIISLTNSV